MKSIICKLKISLFLVFPVICYAQTQSIGIEGNRNINYQTFTPEPSVAISEELMTFTQPSLYNHPEFGKNPFNTPCKDCIELLDRRTENTRYFIKKGSNGGYFYKQTSSLDLHYKNKNGEYLTIDSRLKPTHIPGIYSAKEQSNKTFLNLQEGYSAIEIMPDVSIKFNRKLNLFSANTLESKNSIPTSGNYSQYTVGDQGCNLINSWSGINTELQYSEGSIKTNFIIQDLSAIDTDSKYTVFEDILDIPSNMKIIYDKFEGSFNENGIWQGDLLLVDANEMEFIRFSKPVVYDSDTSTLIENQPFISGYKLVEESGIYRIQLFVSNSYLTNSNRSFPITIDPLVFVTTNWVGTSGSNFTPSYCSFILNVTTPANATLTNATLYTETIGSGLGDCGPLVTQRCYIDKIRIIFSNSCGTSPGAGFAWGCLTPCAFYTTFYFTLSEPTLVTCLTPQCAPYDIPFTYSLGRTACAGGTCLTNCVRVQRFEVTIEGHTIEPLAVIGAIGMDTYTILDCITQSATFTANVLYGVPPYSYTWSPSGGTGATDTDVYPLGVTVVTLTVTDACGNIITDNVTVTNPCLLPISLTSFNGYHADGKNYLHWTTESEKNSELFFIERSFDGLSFEAIGSLPAAGNSNSIIDYNFIDTKPGASINYYRLREKDLDGTISYSGIIAIRSEQLNVNSIALNSSNPTSGELNVSVISAMEGNGNFEIIDISGRIIFNKNIFLNTGINSVMLYPGQIAAGTYILKFTKNDQFETIKFESY